MKNILHREAKGQSLIEIVVAVGIIMVVLVGVSDLISRSLSLASFQAGKNAATNIAQSQLNHFRQQKDLEPSVFFTGANLVTPSPCYNAGVDFDDTKYICTVEFVNNEVSGVIESTEITVNVEWKDGDKTINTRLTQTLVKPKK